MEELTKKALILAKTKEVVGALNIKVNESPMHKVEEFINLTVELGVADNFVALCENSLNNSELSYMNGFQKFLWLKKDYEKRVVDKIVYDSLGEIEKRAFDIAKKVKSVTNIFEETEYKRETGLLNCKELGFRNFGDYFLDDEIRILEKIGTLKKCISLQKGISGRDLLSEKLVKIMANAKKVEARTIFKIGDNTIKIENRKVSALIRGAL